MIVLPMMLLEVWKRDLLGGVIVWSGKVLKDGRQSSSLTHFLVTGSSTTVTRGKRVRSSEKETEKLTIHYFAISDHYWTGPNLGLGGPKGDHF